jgi:MFS family permease
MIDVSEKSWLKYFLFGSLYFSEGLHMSLAEVIVPVYLLSKGVSIPVVTLIAGVAGAPWYLKFLFGPTTDYFCRFGRKPFIIVGGLLGAGSLFVLIFIDPLVAIIPFVLFLFLSHLGIIYLDVSSDGWAIQISKEKERGKINGAMFAGLFTGMAVGTSMLAAVAQVYGYSMAFLAGGSIVLFIIIYPLLVKEHTILKQRQQIASMLKKEFKKRTTQLVAVFGFAQSISFGIVLMVIPLYMKTMLHMDVGQIGLVTTIFPMTIIIGSLLGGALSDRWSRQRIIFIFFSPCIVVSAALIYASNWQIIAILYGLIGFLQGGGIFAAGSALMMDVTNPKIGASQYSILASISNLGERGAEGISGSLVALLGFSRVFLFTAWSIGPALLILYFIRPKKNEIYGADYG